MKKIIGALIALYSAFAFSATLVPIQLLNPTGSTTGQMLVSAGAGSAPVWSNAPTITGGTINGAVIGGTTTAAGSFTTLSASGLISPTSTIGIKGTVTNDSPAAGSVGENPSNSATGTSLTTATNANAVSTPLSAGDWDLECVATFVPNAAPATTVNSLIVGVSTTSATFATVNTGATVLQQQSFTAGQQQTIASPVWTAKLASAGTGYCVVNATFGTSTMTVNGFIRARRPR
jgi:hypothetical protein